MTDSGCFLYKWKRLIAAGIFHVVILSVFLSSDVVSFEVRPLPWASQRGCSLLFLKRSSNGQLVDSFETSSTSSKGIVASLTNVVNFFMDRNSSDASATAATPLSPPPSSPEELMNRIRADYTERNYLWTGHIDLPCFEPDCKFTDPTLSFIGRDKFVSNVQNLRPIVDVLLESPDDCRSELLDISVNDEYVQSRWNMVGELKRIPWKPKIDVIGRTKFWYRPVGEGGVRVFFYDECWEIPAARALLQLITPAGTISNQP